jgi:hypothetical protein
MAGERDFLDVVDPSEVVVVPESVTIPAGTRIQEACHEQNPHA